MRVLLIAEAANPEWTSVPLVGWSHAHALSRVADTHVVTQIRNQEAFERSGLSPSAYTCIDSEAVARATWRIGKALRGGDGKGWTTLMAFSALSYIYFERLLWRQFGPRIRAGEFDIVHRITPLSPTIPSPIAARCARYGVPFVLGPLNGGVPWPREFNAERRREREWLSYVRGAYRFIPGYGATRRCASGILIGSRDTWKQMPGRFHPRCVYIPENGIDPERFSRPVSGEVGRPVRAAFVGRLVPYKGADMLIEAAAPLIREGRLRLDILGDGPDMQKLKDLVSRASLGHGVELPGWVEHAHLQDRLRQSDVLAFPSIREFGGGVVIEAMALGLVPVVVDYGGPAELITPESGIAVPIGTREQIIARFRDALRKLVDHPAAIRPMGQRARVRVLKYFTWDAKARQVLEVYKWLLGSRSIPSEAELFGPSCGTRAISGAERETASEVAP